MASTSAGEAIRVLQSKGYESNPHMIRDLEGCVWVGQKNVRGESWPVAFTAYVIQGHVERFDSFMREVNLVLSGFFDGQEARDGGVAVYKMPIPFEHTQARLDRSEATLAEAYRAARRAWIEYGTLGSP